MPRLAREILEAVMLALVVLQSTVRDFKVVRVEHGTHPDGT